MIRMHRRLFLQGAKRATLVLPFLPSLLPNAVRAQGGQRPVRYLQVMNPYGPKAEFFFGSVKANQRIEPNVNVRKLTEVQGNISAMVGAGFSPYKDKISLLQGLDVLAVSTHHQYTYPTCACSYEDRFDGDEYPPVTGQRSIDTIIAQSPRVYGPTTPATRKAVNLNPVTTDGYSNSRSFSWQTGGSGVQIVRPVKRTQSLFDTFASGFGVTMPGSGPDPAEVKLVQAVYQDYKAVRDGARISSADRTKLEGYMGLIADIESELKNQTMPDETCASPTNQEMAGSIDSSIDNQFRILAAAMVCDLTRVASITLGMSAGYEPRHAQHHALENGTSESQPLIDDFKRTGERVARLVKILGDIDDGAGSLLDNSIVYWSMQYGCSQPIAGGQHIADNMPVLVAGGAGGKLLQGHFVNYQLEGGKRGIALNNLLVTFMNCMGLASGDYESKAGEGYGYYGTNSFAGRPNGSFWSSTNGRRAALPFIYRGTMTG